MQSTDNNFLAINFFYIIFERGNTKLVQFVCLNILYVHIRMEFVLMGNSIQGSCCCRCLLLFGWVIIIHSCTLSGHTTKPLTLSFVLCVVWFVCAEAGTTDSNFMRCAITQNCPGIKKKTVVEWMHINFSAGDSAISTMIANIPRRLSA
jgi:hypothetical protein